MIFVKKIAVSSLPAS